MKKVVSFIIAAALAVTLAVPMFASAEGKNKFIVSKVTAENGKAIVEISIENNTPFSAMDLDVYYNKDSVKLTAYRKGEVINTASGMSMVNPVKGVGLLKMTAITHDAFRRSGVVIYLYFDVPDGAYLYSPVTIDVPTFADFDLKPMEYDVENGGIMRTPYVTPEEMSQPEVSEEKAKNEQDMKDAGNIIIVDGSEKPNYLEDEEVSEMPAAVYDAASAGVSDPNANDENISAYFESVLADESAAAASAEEASLAANGGTTFSILGMIAICGGAFLILAGGAAVLIYVFVIKKRKQENQTNE